jgi:prolyl oligopeptidase
MTRPAYPHTPTVDQVDDFHGTAVPDPYRWLEDSDAPATRDWIAAQNKLTFAFLEQIPERAQIRSRLTALWDYPKRWAPLKRGTRYFQLRNAGLQNQSMLYVMEDSADDGRVLLDPNTLSPDGTTALSNWSISDDGSWLAYATSAAGSDWMTWRVRSVETGEDLPDIIQWSKFSGAAWHHDGSGFYYARYAAPAPGQDYTGANYFQKLYFHRLGQPQADDVLVYERPDQKEWGFDPTVSEDGRYLILHVWQGTDERNRVFYADLAGEGAVIELVGELEAAYHFVGNDGPLFYFTTDLGAPRGRLIAMDTAQPGVRTVIPESTDTLSQAIMAHDEFVVLYLHDAAMRIERFSRAGAALGEIPLPTLGAVPTTGNFLNFTAQRSDNELFYGFSSFLYPITIFRYDFQRAASEVLFAPPLDFDAGDFVTRQVFVASQDGTQVPMFLTHRRDLALDRANPTLLYGYGGFNIALAPEFSVERLVWLEMGGVLAWANLRGGGEYGEAWHKAGMLANKQQVFDDFIACVEYLIAHKVTSTPKLAIMGRSNGGLLVGATMTQRPELFGAAVPVVGVLDMLRFHRFTIGWAWVSDYGCADDPEGFQVLHAYSPLHNARPGLSYPATLVVTGDHDDRVVPGHSFKFAAALQAAQAGEAPVLIRVQARAGHGLGKPTAILIDEAADIWAFLRETLRG